MRMLLSTGSRKFLPIHCFLLSISGPPIPWCSVTMGADVGPSRRLGLCTFTLAVAVGAVLLLPFSIISNEVLLSFPHNYYIQWLNGSLVHGGCTGWLQDAPRAVGQGLPPQELTPFLSSSSPGLWNLVFLFSNLSLVFLMPFAYFFTESEGFAGSKKVGGGVPPCPPLSLAPH